MTGKASVLGIPTEFMLLLKESRLVLTKFLKSLPIEATLGLLDWSDDDITIGIDDGTTDVEAGDIEGILDDLVPPMLSLVGQALQVTGQFFGPSAYF